MSAKELNIGDYVRTKEGIEKIICIEENFMDDNVTFYATDNDIWRSAYNGRYNGFTSRSDVIIKSSPNIIDLLELRDIVELFEEDDVDGELTGFYEVLAYTTDRKEIGVRNKDGEIDLYPAENLRGIITYEQIANMEYKIGGDK